MTGRVGPPAAALAILALAVGAAPASAGQLLSTTVKAEGASARSCINAVLGGSSVAKRTVTAPSAGWVTARLKGASGDWDLAVFDAASGRRVTGSAYFGADEVAKGLVAAGQELMVQACRRSNSSERAALEVESDAIDPDAATEKVSLVRVSTPNAARKRELTQLGVDLTEHGGKGFVEVVLHGAADARKLRGSKFVYTTEVRDLSDQTKTNFAADRRYSAAVRKSALPSGRDSYRMLEDYANEMKQLAAQNPNLVKPITLPFETGEGRKVEGIEITENAKARDGKPVFVQMGVHHAREWPSGEHAMEFAHELVNGYKSNNPRIKPLVARTRTIVVPIVNPDGFNFSRLAGEAQGATLPPGGGRGAPDPGEDDETVNIVSHPGEYRRKNCRLTDSSTDANCAAAPAAGLAAVGVDPNRNYGGLWGGPGNSSDPTNETYRGPAPFSEPETRNVKHLVSTRQATTLITNHTFSDLVLRPPGVAILGPPPDENKGYKALGDAMAAQNGYTSQKGFELYDTTGTTEDWSYGATGGFGFTFEIGCVTELPNGSCDVGHFHPPYSEVVKEYEGTSTRADEGGRDGKGNREAYLIALESTGNENRHVVIDGKATPGAVLRLKKSFLTKTSPVLDASGQEGPVQTFPDVLDTTMQVGSSGFYRYHANPSTRPDVAIQRGRAPTGPASPPQAFTGGIAGPPADGAAPSGDAESTNPLTFNEHVITVPSGGFDNAKMTVRIEWAAVTDDWDTKLFRDTNGNSAVDAGEPVVGTSQQGTTDFEQVSIPNPVPGGKYIYRVTNFAAGPQGAYEGRVSFSQPFFQAAQRESWTMTCESAETGKVGEKVSVLIDRGQRKTISFGAPCRKVVEAGRCVGTRGGVKSSSVGGAKLGRSRKGQRRRLRVARLARGRRAGLDRYCVQGGGTMRVGYPTKRFNSKISRKTRKRYASKAIFIVSNSKRLRLKKLRAGSRVKTLRRRLKGERSFKIGRIRWYTVAGKRSRLLFSTRKGKVREVGLASKKLTSTRRGTVRLLRAWDKRG